MSLFCNRFIRLAAGLLALGLFMQGCGKLPRPFQTHELEEKKANGLLAIRAGRGVLVLPPEGAPDEDFAQRLAEDLKKGLHQMDVLASTDKEIGRAYILSGLLDHDGQTLRMAWILRDTSDITRGKGIVQVRADYLDWRQGSETVLEKLAGDAAIKVASILKPATIEAATKEARVKQAKVAVTGVAGAPGDGNLSLARSLRAHLRSSGLPFTEDSGAASVHVAGIVKSAPVDAKTDKITLTWIFSTPDGSELARINQSNHIPHGMLDGRWGDVAYDVTSALVGAVKQTLAMLHERDGLGR